MTVLVQVARSTRVTLQLDEESAQLLSATLYNAVNFARNPWAQELVHALEDHGVESTQEQLESNRNEIERYVEETQDAPVEPPDVIVIDGDDDEDF